MSFLDGLGLGYIFGTPPYYGNPQAMANIPYQPYSYTLHCIHDNCPICKERLDNEAKLWKEEQDKIALKKQVYEKRCVEYMKNLRKKISLNLRSL